MFSESWQTVVCFWLPVGEEVDVLLPEVVEEDVELVLGLNELVAVVGDSAFSVVSFLSTFFTTSAAFLVTALALDFGLVEAGFGGTETTVFLNVAGSSVFEDFALVTLEVVFSSLTGGDPALDFLLGG
ncbi:MAG: hypothetical protein MI753_16535, partial [Hyphomicrobiales bacterium]|nr:hypothetical protein [Hyphomicrobiales bacterium]